MAIDLNIDGNHVSYLRAPDQNHHAVTKRYADTKLSLLGGSMQGGIGMAGNRISHLGHPVQSNDAVRSLCNSKAVLSQQPKLRLDARSLALFNLMIYWVCWRKTCASSNRVTEKTSSSWFAGFLFSTKCFFKNWFSSSPLNWLILLVVFLLDEFPRELGNFDRGFLGGRPKFLIS